MHNKIASFGEIPILKPDKAALISTKGKITVRLTAILELNISMALTGKEHMIQRFFPSRDRDAEAVEVMVTNTAMTSGSTCRSI